MLRVICMDITNIQHSMYQCWYVLSFYTLMRGLSCPPAFPHILPLTTSLGLLPSTVSRLFFTCNAIPSIPTQLKLLPCFSPPCVCQLLLNSSILGQTHWISKPLAALGAVKAQPIYQIPASYSISSTRIFNTLSDSYSVKQDIRRNKPQNIFFSPVEKRKDDCDLY